MVYKRLHIQIVIRVIFITSTIFLLFYAHSKLNEWIIDVNILLLVALQVWLFIRYMNRVNRKLEDFFMAMENDDTSLRLALANDEKWKTLYQRMNAIIDKISWLKVKNEEQYLFLKTIVEHLNTGIIVYDTQGNVKISNKQALHILGTHKLENITVMDNAFPGFSSYIRSLPVGRQRLIKLKRDGEVYPLTLRSGSLKIREEQVHLLTINNIKNELDDYELESWQKLTRVLTHEIMNSIGPIGASINAIMHIFSSGTLTEEMKQDINKGLHIIKSRSLGMGEFVENFRSLTRIPELNLKKFAVEEVIKDSIYLLTDELTSIGTDIKCYPQTITLVADKNLIQQVLINLLKNAVDALHQITSPKIRVKAFYANERTLIQVINNGKMLDAEEKENFFIPFYTTKQNGSGIGLSLARQIMHMHGGSISVSSAPGETIFTLTF